MLNIKNLHAKIGEKEILKGIDLHIGPGEIHAVMGPNGAGKSTLSAVLTGRPDYEVTEGSILYKGEDLLQKTPEERAEIMRQGLTADNFLTSFNAVSEDGVLFNIDGNGNRVSAITFAAKSVVALVGINKIVPQESDLEKRALTVAAPLNAKRLKLSNEHDICDTFVKTRICKPAGRIKIILVGEELGY